MNAYQVIERCEQAHHPIPLPIPNLLYVTLKSWASLSSSSVWYATKHLKFAIKGHSRVQIQQIQANLMVPITIPNMFQVRIPRSYSQLLYKSTWRGTIPVEALLNPEDHCWSHQHRNWVDKPVLTLQENNSLYQWRRNPTQRTPADILTSARDWKLLVDFKWQLKLPSHPEATTHWPDGPWSKLCCWG